MLQIDPADKTRLIDPLFRTGPRFWLAFLALGGLVASGVLVYLPQLETGLSVTGMDRPAYWGVYIVNFIFLIGVSMAGTVITAVLQIMGVNWRRPITRIAEAATVFGLLVAALQILIDMGRPERMLYMLLYGRLQSPLLWDMASLSLYLLTSIFALYVSLLPDLAIIRDNLPAGMAAWRRLLYTALSLGWRGNREQWLRLDRVLRVTAIAVIPMGVALHTVTSWILSTTLQPGWHSTILGPYFVVGAIFSGIALLFILMTIFRRATPARFYVDEGHYRKLGWLFITMCVVWFYFTLTEHVTIVTGQEPAEFAVMTSKISGPDAPPFWAMLALMLLAAGLLILPHLLPSRLVGARFFQPRLAGAMAGGAALIVAVSLWPVRPLMAGLDTIALQRVLLPTAAGLALLAALSGLAWLKRHVQAHIVVASFAVVAGMWLERWNIVVPTLAHPRLIAWRPYTPTLTEWVLTAASFALFGLLMLLFFKLFPVVSLWEVAEGRVVDAAQAKLEIPLPPEAPRSGWPRWSYRRQS